MILDLHRQGLSISAIARELGIDRKTVRRTIVRGLEPPVYGPRKPRRRLSDPSVPYLRERVTAYPGLTGQRLWRQLRERGYTGGYTAVTDLLRELRPMPLPAFEVRFETPPGDQAQVDFAHFQVVLTDEPSVMRIVWLFSFVLGHSRLIWARFVLHQDMQTVLRCHMAAFEVIAVWEDPQAEKPSYLMWLEWMDGRISFIRDYRYVRYIVDDAELVLAPDTAPPGEGAAHG